MKYYTTRTCCRTRCNPFTHWYSSFYIPYRTAAFTAHPHFFSLSMYKGEMQWMLVGGLNSWLYDKEENKCHFTLSLSLSSLSVLASSVFFYPCISFFSLSLVCLWTLWLLTYTTVFDNTLFRTCMTYYAVLQCTTLSSNTITIQTHIHQIVFVHMQRHAKERVDLSSVLHMHTHAHKIKSVHCAMINRLYKTVKVVFFYLLC